MKTYLVIINQRKLFIELSKNRRSFFHGNRGILVMDEEPALTIHRVVNGDKLDSFKSWCESNILKEFKTLAMGTLRARQKAVARWEASKVAIERARQALDKTVQAEEDARMVMARAHQGRSVVVNGTTLFATHMVSSTGKEVVQYYRPIGPWKLDTV